MRDKPDYYDVEELRLFLVETHMEIRTPGSEVRELTLSPMHRGFLLALTRKYPDVISYQELWKDVWRSKYEMTVDDRAKIQTTKGQLINWLKSNNITSLTIKSQPGQGYCLSNEVIPGYFDDDQKEINIDELSIEAENTNDEAPLQQLNELTSEKSNKGKIDGWKELVFSNSIYIISVALCYGVLFQITLFLEIAYGFDIYGGQAVFGGLILLFVNIAAFLTASSLMSYRLYNGKAGLLPAAGIMLAAILLSIVISERFLPIQSVTKAVFQTQPALIAFWKNALIYFFPLIVVFVLLPLYTINAKRLIELQIIREMPFDFIFIKPKWLLIICLCIMFFSFATTNYFLDHLNSESVYYPLFVAFILLRAFIYFGIAFSSLAWYQVKFREN
jgi:DNA-binding winged helix-turn-helix (wHTH) protein